MSILRPTTRAQLREAIAWAAQTGEACEIVGTGSKRGLGRPVQASHTLDLSALTGILEYEPAELVLTARAGTTMAEIEAAVAAKRQMLGFEPPDLNTLYGQSGGTIGGVLACNLAGPRRIKLGAARDHFLGFAAVSGRGEEFKAGGKVVKNVTGYDLPKLLAGSFGTLAAMDEVTIKVLPAPEKTRTVLVYDLPERAGVAALADALNSPFEVSGAAHLPAAVAARSAVDRARGAVTAIRVEGTAVSVAARCEGLRRQFTGRRVDELHSMNSAMLWREIRDVARLLPDASRAIWRISVPPADGPDLAGLGECFYDWGGGLVWIACDPAGDGGAAAIRARIKSGHATLVRGPAALRAAGAFEPQGATLAALAARIKNGFDPKRILNPGRMTAGA